MEFAPKYILEVHLEGGRATSNSLADRVLEDYEEGLLGEDEVLRQHAFAYSIPVEVLCRCSKCYTASKQKASCSYYYDYYAAFWNRLKAKTNEAIEELLGINLKEAEAFTESFSIEPGIVDQLSKANASRYASIKRLADVTRKLPAEKGGGGELLLIVSAVLISLLSSALYDVAKAGGVGLLATLKRAFRNTRIKKAIAEVMENGDIVALVDSLTDADLIRLLGGSYKRSLTNKQRQELIRLAADRRAKDLRRQLIAAAANKKRRGST